MGDQLNIVRAQVGANSGGPNAARTSSSVTLDNSNEEQHRAQNATSPTMVRNVERRRCSGV
jgi:hypothetical protein